MRTFRLFLLVAALACCNFAIAGEPAEEVGAAPPPGQILPSPPAWLPRYTMAVRLDTVARKAVVHQVVRWTNPGIAPTDLLIFHVYPRHRPNARQLMVYERTFESLRMDARTAFDRQGRRLNVRQIRSSTGAELSFEFDAEHDTRMKVHLPGPVAPGESIEVALDWELDIPLLQGRVGQHEGVTTLLNWYPILAVYNRDGWDAPPFVAWHLSFFNEAAAFRVTLDLPQGEQVANSGQVVARSLLPDGYQRLEIVGEGLRDFTLVASRRFAVFEGVAEGVKIRVLAFPEHRFYAQQALQTAMECLPLYSRWFGKYPFAEFAVVESFFGWNGNQSTGLVLIDERVFRAPELGHRYIDHLMSHEICHQWWYVLVGNNGYRETWISESTTSYFTKLRMREKYGPNCEMLTWPGALSWMPNISYDTNLHGGYYLYRSRGGNGQSVAPLPEMIHLHNLFFLVYDRGLRVVGMIHHRLGSDERFLAFSRRVVQRYAYRNCSVDDFRRELEFFTGADWMRFFDDWLRSPRITDWKMGRVDVRVAPRNGFCTTIRIKQLAEIREPTEIGFRAAKGGPIIQQIPFDPEKGDHSFAGGSVRRCGENEWELSFTSEHRPVEIEIDPEHWLLDANLANNGWRMDIPVRFTPFYTPIDEAPLAHPLDRPSFVFGPGIDIDGRFGIRGALVKGFDYRISPFLAYEPTRGMLTTGVDGEYFNTPLPNVSVGARYEHVLASSLYNAPTDEGRLFMRWYQAYTSSFIYPHLAFLEGYSRFGDNFFPIYETIREPTDPRIKDYRNIRAVGLTYHADTRYPYWNPEKGFVLDANGELGFRLGGKGEDYQRIYSQIAAVHRLPDEWGPLSDLRVAGRIAGGYGSPDDGYHFRFGGPLGFRGQRSEDTPASAYWLTSAELRFPLLQKIDLPIADNVVGWQSLYGSLFYDVGDAWLLGEAAGVDHTVGAGLYFELGVLSFVERIGLRLEYGHSVNRGTDMVWFGLFHAF